MHAGNKFLQDYKPWESIKSDKELCGSYLAACMGLVALLAALVEPYMPSVTRKVSACCQGPSNTCWEFSTMIKNRQTGQQSIATAVHAVHRGWRGKVGLACC